MDKVVPWVLLAVIWTNYEIIVKQEKPTWRLGLSWVCTVVAFIFEVIALTH